MTPDETHDTIVIGASAGGVGATEHERGYRSLLEQLPVPLWIDRDNKIVFINPAGLQLLGARAPEEVLGRPPFEFIHPDFHLIAEARFRNAAAGARLPAVEERFVRVDGSPVDVEVTSAHFPYEDGSSILVNFVDITARKRAEQTLRKTKDSLIRIQRLARLGNWEEDVATGELEWSDEVYDIFGVLPSVKPAVESFFALVHPDDRDSVSEAVRQAVTKREPCRIEHRIVRPDGAERHVREYAEVILDEAGNRRLAGAVQDITDYKRLEAHFQQAQKMEAVGSLAGGVAHDFNNLLTIINGYGEMILQDLGREHPLRLSVQEIVNAGHRAATLTRQLLAFSRRQTMQLQVLDLNAVVADLEKMLRRIVIEDIEIVLNLGTDLRMVQADPHQIEQVLMNLVANSRDAMAKGGTLTIRTSNVEITTASGLDLPPGPYVLLQVSDIGHGMDEETRRRAFEPFFTTKPSGKGTGLGLSTVYGIVKQHRGDISVESEVGRGTTFRIYFPTVSELNASQSPGAVPAATGRGSETILLVEDEAGVRRSIREMLTNQGYRVLEAQSAENALRLLNQHCGEIGLLLTDVVMPEMNGPEVAKHVARVCPNLKALFMSGYTGEVIENHGVSDLGPEFIQKPFSSEALGRKVRQLLDARRSGLR